MDYTDVQKKQGELIKSVRIQLGLSGEELGNKLEVSKATISLWETGKTSPRIDKLNELAKLSGKDISYFYEDTGLDQLIEYNITNLKKTLDSINDINPLSLKNQYKNSKTADREFFIKQLPHMMTNKELSIFLIFLYYRVNFMYQSFSII